jgi:hypothetical protein
MLLKLKKFLNWKILTIILFALIFGTALLFGVNQFFDKNKLEFERPIQVSLHFPIRVEQRQLTNIIQVIGGENLPLTENEKYLCIKFGDQCKTALEVQRRENPKGNCEAFYINNNGTIDLGFMQINSVHLNSNITLSQLVDCKSNIDVAYDIYKRDGWKAWVTYKAVIK